jgi:hypothetical protein
LPFSIYQDADLPAGFVRQFGKLAGEFRRDDLAGGHAAGAEALDSLELVVL